MFAVAGRPPHPCYLQPHHDSLPFAERRRCSGVLRPLATTLTSSATATTGMAVPGLVALSSEVEELLLARPGTISCANRPCDAGRVSVRVVAAAVAGPRLGDTSRLSRPPPSRGDDDSDDGPASGWPDPNMLNGFGMVLLSEGG
jgi:hypothetical protein